MSKFLFVSSFDSRRNTSGNIRLVALMKGLHDAGHTVHCIFSPTDKVSDSIIFNTLSKMDRITTFPKIEFKPVTKETNNTSLGKVNLKTKLSRIFIKIYTPLSVYDVYKLKIDRVSLEDLQDLDDEYDYIVSSSDPKSSHVFAEKIIRLKHYTSKWIMYWGDPMTSDVSANKIFTGRIKKEERKLIKKSDLSVYTNPCVVEYMKHQYPELAPKITWIPTSDIKDNIELTVTDSKKIGYFGDYSPVYRNIIPFYEACVENKFETIICGSGAGVELLSTDTIQVKGRISRKEVNIFEKDCKILIVIENKTKTGKCIQIPGKLYHYALTNKEILVVTESNNLARDYGHYNRFHFVPNHSHDIADAIKAILKNSNSNISSEPLASFMPENIVKQFEAIIKL